MNRRILDGREIHDARRTRESRHRMIYALIPTLSSRSVREAPIFRAPRERTRAADRTAVADIRDI